MKKLVAALAVAVSAAVLAMAAHPAFAADFSVKRFVICTNVQDHEPMGVADTFDAKTDKVYAYLEATDITAPTTVTVVWSYNGEEQRRTQLNLGQSSRWRTYAYKNLYGLAGSWRVDLLDASGNVVSTASFTVK